MPARGPPPSEHLLTPAGLRDLLASGSQAGLGAGVFKEGPVPCPKSDLQGRPFSDEAVGGTGRPAAGEPRPVLTAVSLPPSHLCAQGLPGKLPPDGGPGTPAGQPFPVAVLHCREGSGAGCIYGRVRVPQCFFWFSVNAVAPRAWCLPCPGGGWPGPALLTRPPGAGPRAGCSQGLSLWIPIKPFHKPARCLLLACWAGPCAGLMGAGRGAAFSGLWQAQGEEKRTGGMGSPRAELQSIEPAPAREGCTCVPHQSPPGCGLGWVLG